MNTTSTPTDTLERARQPIGQIAVELPGSTAVFRRLKLDFCCGGQIALQQAEGTLAQNQAQLKNAQIDLERYKGLFAEDSIAKQTLDTQAALVA